MRFQDEQMLHLLWLLPGLLLLWFHASRRRRQALERFAVTPLLAQLSQRVLPRRRLWKQGLLFAAFAAGILALARPAWSPETQTVHREGRDVVFIVDVSRSMLAEDLAPNRLDRAKLAIQDCLEGLNGDRVGLIAFAGSSVVKCPLTLDYGFFRMMLDGTGPEDVSRGGTLVGDALRKALSDVFDDQEREFRDIILITDGSDHESRPLEAAQNVASAGIRLIAIGLGDETQGARIPITDANGQRTFLKYQGKEVWAKLDAEVLREMALATPGGKYLNVATGTFDLDAIYQEFVASARKKALEDRQILIYEEKYQIFLGLGFLLLCAEALLGDRRPSTE